MGVRIRADDLIRAYDVLDAATKQLVDQVTLKKLEFVRELLVGRDMSPGGTRLSTRQRVAFALQSGEVSLDQLQELIKELDLWGDQRLRLMQLPAAALPSIRNQAPLAGQFQANFGFDPFNEKHDLAPEATLQLLYAEYAAKPGGRQVLRVVVGRQQVIENRVPEEEIQPIRVEDQPDLVFIPFRIEKRNAITFAEIDLASGLVVLSTTAGRGTDKELASLLVMVQGSLSFQLATRKNLEVVAGKVNCGTLGNEVRRCRLRRRTAQGSEIDVKGASVVTDLGVDPEALSAIGSTPAASNRFANCIWQTSAALDRDVHCHIWAPEGELTILGQVLELHVEHVLQRVLFHN